MAPIKVGRKTRLLASLLLAAVGGIALTGYVRGLEANAAERNESVSVFVARDTIPVGTKGNDAISQNLIARESVPRRLVVAGAIVVLSQIQDKVALATIVKGEQLTTARFGSPQSRAELPIPAGTQAMSLEVEIERGVGGYLRPGDRVSIVAHFEDQVARLVVQDVLVLAVTPRLVVRSGGKEDSGSTRLSRQNDKLVLTIAVTPGQAEQLSWSLYENDAEIHFTLLAPGQRGARTPGRNADNLFR